MLLFYKIKENLSEFTSLKEPVNFFFSLLFTWLYYFTSFALFVLCQQ